MYLCTYMYVCAAYRRITTVNSWLLEQGVDVAKVWQDIEVLYVRTCAVMYVHRHTYVCVCVFTTVTSDKTYFPSAAFCTYRIRSSRPSSHVTQWSNTITPLPSLIVEWGIVPASKSLALMCCLTTSLSRGF